eukprot:1669354-Alexandrium_andersonii.AAC.1
MAEGQRWPPRPSWFTHAGRSRTRTPAGVGAHHRWRDQRKPNRQMGRHGLLREREATRHPLDHELERGDGIQQGGSVEVRAAEDRDQAAAEGKQLLA